MFTTLSQLGSSVLIQRCLANRWFSKQAVDVKCDAVSRWELLVRSLFAKTAIYIFALSCVGYAAEVPRLEELSSGDFKVREAARMEILEWVEKNPDKADGELCKVYFETDDPEIQLQIETILKERFSGNGKAFLGVNFLYEIHKHEGDDLPGIRVTGFDRAGEAKRAGLKINDFILEVGDLRLAAGMKDEDVVSGIQRQKAGEKVDVELIRHGKTMIFRVRLAEHPEALAETPEQLERRFERWLTQREEELEGS